MFQLFALQYPLLIVSDIFPCLIYISNRQTFTQRTHLKIGPRVFQLQKIKCLRKGRNSNLPQLKFFFESQLRGFH